MVSVEFRVSREHNAVVVSPVMSVSTPSGPLPVQYVFVAGGTGNAIAVFGRDLRTTIPSPANPNTTIPNPNYGTLIFQQELRGGFLNAKNIFGPAALAIDTTSGTNGSLIVAIPPGLQGETGGLDSFTITPAAPPPPPITLINTNMTALTVSA